jgi:hypothetical protein
MPGGNSKDVVESTNRFLSFPPVLNRSLGDVMSAFAELMKNLQQGTDDGKLELALRSHPEGTLYLLHGYLLWVQKRYSEARLQLLSASRLPSIIPVHHLALSMVILCDGELLNQNRDPDFLREIVGDVRALMKLGPLTPMEAPLCGKLAFEAKEFGLAQSIADDLEKIVGPGSGPLQTLRMQIAYRQGNYGQAIDMADRILKARKDDGVALKIRKESAEKLLRLAERLKP